MVERMLTPVALPPGWLKLATRPKVTGSPPVVKTIGIVGVAALAARGDGASRRDDHGDPSANEIGGQLWQPIELTFRPAVFDGDVRAFDIAGVLEALADCLQALRDRVRRCGVEEADHRH